jgi:UDP-glucose:(heptosyl)LPS alpha-1,3-glucosyltransferase
MIRLAVVRQRYHAYGSSERSVARALSALSANGTLEVTLIARRWDDDSGWRTRRVDPFSLTRIGRDRTFAQAASACFGEYDVVQSHERIPGTTIFRAVDGVHATWVEQSHRAQRPGSEVQRWLSHYDRHVMAAEAETLRHPALKYVLCNSKMVAADIERRFNMAPPRMALVYNAVDGALYNPGLVRHRSGWRQDNGIDAAAPLLAMVGSDFVRRGVSTALAAIETFPNLYLAIAGSDKQAERYGALAERMGIEARVRFLGPLPNLRRLYGAADAFILPSLYDPFPNACAEALASGLPVFTSPTCGAADWIRAGENGWVVDALDVAGYRDAVADWLHRRTDWPAMRQAARKSAEPYSLERMVAELAALYQRSLTG